MAAKYPFEVVFHPDAPQIEVSAWEPTLRLMADVVNRYHIKLHRVKMHYHKKKRTHWGAKHPFGESEYWDGYITLCANDFDTALHELAHVWSKNRHTDKWARCYLMLLERYLPREDFFYRLNKAKKDYKPCARMAHLFELVDDDE